MLLPGVPRVCPLFIESDSRAHPLDWRNLRNVRLKATYHTTCDSSRRPRPTTIVSCAPVLVKLLNRDARPDLQVNKALTDAGLAPHLLGIAKLEGAELVAVIEYLVLENGPMTLYQHLKAHAGVEIQLRHPGP